MISYFAAFVSIFLGAIAQYFLKLGMINFNNSKQGEFFEILKALIFNCPLFVGLVCYGLSMFFWLYVLSKIELSRAYPLVSLGYIVTLLLGYFLLNEALTFSKIFGVMLIISGVVFISR